MEKTHLLHRRRSAFEVNRLADGGCRCCGVVFEGSRWKERRWLHEHCSHECGRGTNKCEFHVMLAVWDELHAMLQSWQLNMPPLRIGWSDVKHAVGVLEGERALRTDFAVASSTKAKWATKRKRRRGRPHKRRSTGKEKTQREEWKEEVSGVESARPVKAGSEEEESGDGQSDNDDDENVNGQLDGEEEESVEGQVVGEEEGVEVQQDDERQEFVESQGDGQSVIDNEDSADGQSLVDNMESADGQSVVGNEESTEGQIVEEHATREQLLAAAVESLQRGLVRLCHCRLSENVRTLFRHFLRTTSLARIFSVLLGAGIRRREFAACMGVTRQQLARNVLAVEKQIRSPERTSLLPKIVTTRKVALRFPDEVIESLTSFLLTQPCSRVHPTRTVGEPPQAVHFLNFSVAASFELYIEHVAGHTSDSKHFTVDSEWHRTTPNLHEILSRMRKGELRQLLANHGRTVDTTKLKKQKLKELALQVLTGSQTVSSVPDGDTPHASDSHPFTISTATQSSSTTPCTDQLSRFRALRQERRAVGFTFFAKFVDDMPNIRKASNDDFACPLCRGGKVSKCCLQRLRQIIHKDCSTGCPNDASCATEQRQTEQDDNLKLQLEYLEEQAVQYEHHLQEVKHQATAYTEDLTWAKNDCHNAVITMDFSPVNKVWRAKRTQTETRDTVEVLNLTIQRCDNQGNLHEERHDFFSTHDHDAAFVNSALRELLSLPEMREFRNLRWWCDGARAHFKQKVTINNVVTDLRRRFQLSSVIMNFHASYHGKGCCDRHFGVMKHQLRTARAKGDVIAGCEGVTEFVHKHVKNTTAQVLKVMEDDLPDVIGINERGQTVPGWPIGVADFHQFGCPNAMDTNVDTFVLECKKRSGVGTGVLQRFKWRAGLSDVGAGVNVQRAPVPV